MCHWSRWWSDSGHRSQLWQEKRTPAKVLKGFMLNGDQKGVFPFTSLSLPDAAWGIGALVPITLRWRIYWVEASAMTPHFSARLQKRQDSDMISKKQRLKSETQAKLKTGDIQQPFLCLSQKIKDWKVKYHKSVVGKKRSTEILEHFHPQSISCLTASLGKNHASFTVFFFSVLRIVHTVGIQWL